jgi:hypothetical protein
MPIPTELAAACADVTAAGEADVIAGRPAHWVAAPGSTEWDNRRPGGRHRPAQRAGRPRGQRPGSGAAFRRLLRHPQADH